MTYLGALGQTHKSPQKTVIKTETFCFRVMAATRPKHNCSTRRAMIQSLLPSLMKLLDRAIFARPVDQASVPTELRANSCTSWASLHLCLVFTKTHQNIITQHFI